MKKLAILFLIAVMYFPLKAFTQGRVTKELRTELLEFLISQGDYDSTMIHSGTLLIMKDLRTMEDYHGQDGIFIFGTLTSHSYRHLFFKTKDEYIIINMRQPIEDIFKSMLIIFNTSFFSKEDVLEYMKKLIDLHTLNMESSPWKDN